MGQGLANGKLFLNHRGSSSLQVSKAGILAWRATDFIGAVSIKFKQ